MDKIKVMQCGISGTLKDAMACIDKNTKGIAFVVDDDCRMVGLLSDGDIRRLLLNGYGLNEKLINCINRNFHYVTDSSDAAETVQKHSGKFSLIPVLDKERHITDYVDFNDTVHIALAQPQLNRNEYRYLMDAFLSSWISSTGKYINSFEESFAKYCGTKYGVATSNGTTALHLALVALGIGKGDEVIVPNLTFAATVNSVIYTGATPVIVDIEPDGWCINPECIEAAVTERTKAIIPVHLYGQPCDMGRIQEIAKEHGLYIVEDCAEAHGAEWNGRKVGSLSDIACFSFFGNKVITTGEGGMCLTDDEELNRKLRVYRDHGMSKDKRYYHEVIGYNYRMTNLQAAIGTAQVEHIDDILRWRAHLEEMYADAFRQDERIVFQRYDLPGRKKIAWLVSILVNEDVRDKLLDELKENDIDARPFFVPLSKMDIYKAYARECPVSEMISKRGINLPTTYETTAESVSRIYAVIRKVLNQETKTI